MALFITHNIIFQQKNMCAFKIFYNFKYLTISDKKKHLILDLILASQLIKLKKHYFLFKYKTLYRLETFWPSINLYKEF